MKRKELEQFLGGYFHQDWTLEAASADEIVNRYLADEPRERARLAGLQLADLLATTESEETLRSVVQNELGCFYRPEETMRAWLEKLRARLATSESASRSSAS